MANSSSEDETDTLPERPTRIQPYQFEPVRQNFERVPEHHVSFDMRYGVCEIALTAEVLASKMGVMRRSKKVSSFELYKLKESKMATALTPQTDVTSGEAYIK